MKDIAKTRLAFYAALSELEDYALDRIDTYAIQVSDEQDMLAEFPNDPLHKIALEEANRKLSAWNTIYAKLEKIGSQ